MLMTWFYVVSRRKMLALNGEEGLKCEVSVDGVRLEHVSEFKYLRCILDELGTYEAECSRRVVSRRRVASALGLWLMLGVCSLSVLGSCMSHCWCLSLCMEEKERS